MSLAATRLAEERKKWRKDPLFGFALKPSTKPDGTTDMMLWNARNPGKAGTLWDGAKFPVTLRFSPTDYPTAAPVVSFPAGFQHPNVFECGNVCLSLIGQAWRPSVSLKEILLGVQELLDTPNNRPCQLGDQFGVYAQQGQVRRDRQATDPEVQG